MSRGKLAGLQPTPDSWARPRGLAPREGGGGGREGASGCAILQQERSTRPARLQQPELLLSAQRRRQTQHRQPATVDRTRALNRTTAVRSRTRASTSIMQSNAMLGRPRSQDLGALSALMRHELAGQAGDTKKNRASLQHPKLQVSPEADSGQGEKLLHRRAPGAPSGVDSANEACETAGNDASEPEPEEVLNRLLGLSLSHIGSGSSQHSSPSPALRPASSSSGSSNGRGSRVPQLQHPLRAARTPTPLTSAAAASSSEEEANGRSPRVRRRTQHRRMRAITVQSPSSETFGDAAFESALESLVRTIEHRAHLQRPEPRRASVSIPTVPVPAAEEPPAQAQKERQTLGGQGRDQRRAPPQDEVAPCAAGRGEKQAAKKVPAASPGACLGVERLEQVAEGCAMVLELRRLDSVTRQLQARVSSERLRRHKAVRRRRDEPRSAGSEEAGAGGAPGAPPREGMRLLRQARGDEQASRVRLVLQRRRSSASSRGSGRRRTSGRSKTRDRAVTGAGKSAFVGSEPRYTDRFCAQGCAVNGIASAPQGRQLISVV